MQIAGKTALITGGAVRVGKAITLMLAANGANVVIAYHSSAAEAAVTAEAARAHGAGALAVECDVADPAAVQALATRTRDEFGGVDILVNSASLFARTPLPATQGGAGALSQEEIETWRRTTNILVDGPWFVTTALAPSMRARGAGAIVNILDLSVWKPWPHFAAHTAGKAALLGLTRQMALELAPEIRVNAIAPGSVLPPPGYPQQKIEAAARRNLLGRWGSAEDVAHAVRYLIEADFVTGEVLFVDGGERLARMKE